ncbi:MAG: hypothetical protein AAB657_02345 [Patescibacteria group bacterium]
MDKIAKSLRRLSKSERAVVRIILEKLQSGNTLGLTIKKLVGQQDIFRVRKGNIRIIFRYISNEVFILAIERRSESTHRNY